ncbi:hypothetical protein ZWY2020_018397 [Hordeum vulgare]|nr:hypothetical protein ZWY2020_018397 [Hordeum vulgare]
MHYQEGGANPLVNSCARLRCRCSHQPLCSGRGKGVEEGLAAAIRRLRLPLRQVRWTVELLARTYLKDYKPPDEHVKYQAIPLNKTEDFGVHCKQYYSLDITYFKSSMASQLVDLLIIDHKWRSIPSVSTALLLVLLCMPMPLEANGMVGVEARSKGSPTVTPNTV